MGAAIDLLGTGSASITAIADRAGVARVTVYRHFPDEESLLLACTAALFQERPVPDVSRHEGEADGAVRLRLVLEDLFGYYASVERLLAFALEKSETTPTLRAAAAPFVNALEKAYQVVAEAWAASATSGTLLGGAVRHAMAFATWQSLRNEQRLAHGEAIDLMVGLVGSAAAAPGGSKQAP